MNAILGTKLGMTQVFDDQARAIPVTVIKAGPCRVVQIKTEETDGYNSIQISFRDAKPGKVNKPEAGHYAKAGVAPARHLVELRVDDPSAYTVGQEIRIADLFQAGTKADVSGVSKGKGFAGVMERHNFSGQGASHGSHKVHRAPGSIGACATPARVFKGTRMAGRLGGERVTTLNIDIVGVDGERDILLLGGAVPGPKGSVVLVREAVKAHG
ncbi:MAG TPA: 50S ribosomal protein L3 [Acidimicrobiia bacterium]|jgi:large subunit ribosomal protein L3|nr:ribosomal protein [Acidimicrobiia bacterium]HJQ91286.1 50S ribosomal protein L3 [Acidimicrobiia bacterium]